jgi:hypothetical protein
VDELLTPTIQQRRPTTTPWSVEAQLLFSVLFGPLAAGTLAALNAGRLGLRTPVRLAMFASGVAGVVIQIGSSLGGLPLGGRLLANVLGGLCWLAASRPLRAGLRAFLIAGGKTRSIWRDGVWIAVGCAAVEITIVVWLT